MMYIRKKHGSGVFTCHKKTDPEQEKLFKQKLELDKQRELLNKLQEVKAQQDTNGKLRIPRHVRDKAVFPGIPPMA